MDRASVNVSVFGWVRLLIIGHEQRKGIMVTDDEYELIAFRLPVTDKTIIFWLSSAGKFLYTRTNTRRTARRQRHKIGRSRRSTIVQIDEPNCPNVAR